MEHLSISDFSVITWWGFQTLVNSLHLFICSVTPSKTCTVLTRTSRAVELSLCGVLDSLWSDEDVEWV